MPIVMSQAGYMYTLDALVDTGFLAYLRLFQNDHTPADTDTVADYDEADFSGYAQIPMAWAPAVINGSGKGQISAAGELFTRGVGGTSNTIYGAYVVAGAGGEELMFAERFAAPVEMDTPLVSQILYQANLTVVTE